MPGALALLLALLSGCAQIPFPDLPPGLSGRPAADAEATPDAVSGAEEEGELADTAASTEESTEEAAPGQLFEWSGGDRDVTRIIIDTNEQTARFFAGDDQVGWSTIASGVASHPTPRGEFSILEKVRDKRSNLYGKIVGRNGRVIRGNAHGKDPVPPGARFVGASMPHFMRMTYDGIGIHAGPIPNPGSPASHGCIRMPPELAATVFEHVGPNTAVTVIGNGPDYGNYAARIARQRAEAEARRAAAAAAVEGTALDALDAEIEVLKEADVDLSETSEPGQGDSENAASAQVPATTTAEDSTPTPRSGEIGSRASASTGENDSIRTNAQDGTDNARRNGGDRSDSDASAAPAPGASTPAGKLGTSPAEEEMKPGTRPSPRDMPAEAPMEPSPPRDYGPPAPPPTIRSAAKPKTGVSQRPS
jgi:hypothetical protein